MSFQQSAESLRAKAHITSIRPSLLVIVSVVTLITLFLIVQGIWSTLQTSEFEVLKIDASTGESTKNSSSNQNFPSEEGSSTNGATSPSEEVSSEETDLIYVHVGGRVAEPGVYALSDGSRIQAAIDAAGGFSEDAAVDAVNLARVLVDGEQIIVPSREEVNPDNLSLGVSSEQMTRKVNINTATLAELITLPGIGEATAQKIIKDRESNGIFSSPEDIMRVSGIGQKKYEQLADCICI